MHTGETTEEEIARIVSTLQQLTLQSSDLIQRLTELHPIGGETVQPTVQPETGTARASNPIDTSSLNTQEETVFRVGDHVRIINRRGSPELNRGMIQKVNPRRVTVLLNVSNKPIQRAHKNVVHDHNA